MLNNLSVKVLYPVGMIIILTIITGWFNVSEAAVVRIKDICTFQSETEDDLIGYGLVIGLDGTGDGTSTRFTIQSLANMMERLGLTVDPYRMKVKNIAGVLVTARLSSQQPEGSYVDVTVSSLGDASSLQAGTLVMTPLASTDGIVRAIGQGPISIGGFNVQDVINKAEINVKPLAQDKELYFDRNKDLFPIKSGIAAIPMESPHNAGIELKFQSETKNAQDLSKNPKAP